MTGTHQDPAGACHDREDMTRLHDIGGFSIGRYSGLDGAGAIMCGDASRDAFSRFDRYGECRAELGFIVARHLVQAQLAAALFGERQADEAATKAGHEVDCFGRDMVSRQHQIAFVFAIFFIHQYHHTASAEFGNDFQCGGNAWQRIFSTHDWV